MPKKQELYARFMKQVARTIAKSKRQILGIFDTKDGPPFAYTIGNQEKGLPELLVIGICGDDAMTKFLTLTKLRLRRRMLRE